MGVVLPKQTYKYLSTKRYQRVQIRQDILLSQEIKERCSEVRASCVGHHIQEVQGYYGSSINDPKGHV